jgi:phage tail-like protein
MAPQNRDTIGMDPYKNFRFVVSWEGRPVAGISSVSGLSRTAQPIEHREGADPITTPVLPRPAPVTLVTLQRGVTHDSAFASWASNSVSSTPAIQTNVVRKDLYLALYNEAGQQVIGYNLYQCWPSDYEPISEMDANGIVIQRLVLQLQGWEVDTSVTAPASATYTPPAG